MFNKSNYFFYFDDESVNFSTEYACINWCSCVVKHRSYRTNLKENYLSYNTFTLLYCKKGHLFEISEDFNQLSSAFLTFLGNNNNNSCTDNNHTVHCTWRATKVCWRSLSGSNFRRGFKMLLGTFFSDQHYLEHPCKLVNHGRAGQIGCHAMHHVGQVQRFDFVNARRLLQTQMIGEKK